MAELKVSESNACSDSESEPDKGNDKGKHIIDVEPNATIATMKIQKEEPKDPEEEEHLFHSQMWVKGSLLQFIVDRGSQKKLISVEVLKRVVLPTTTHPQSYTIGWLQQGRDLRMRQQCHLPYNIKPFTDEVLCDISPLDVCDVLLGQPYLCKRHVLYESRPRVVTVTLGNKLYRILEVASPTAISLVTTKQCSKLISKNGKFVFLMIHPQGKKKTVAVTSRQGPSARQLNMDKVVEEFVLGFSHITWPLSQVTKGGVKAKFFWSESQQKEFTELKDRLCSAPVLTLPDLQQPFEVKKDASNYAIGAVLTEQGHPVAYHSETFSDTVQKYPTYEKEMYSNVQACQQWKHYILGKEMVIHTYHRPLQFIQAQGKLQNDRHQK
eukprot:PITA_33433